MKTLLVALFFALARVTASAQTMYVCTIATNGCANLPHATVGAGVFDYDPASTSLKGSVALPNMNPPADAAYFYELQSNFGSCPTVNLGALVKNAGSFTLPSTVVDPVKLVSGKYAIAVSTVQGQLPGSTSPKGQVTHADIGYLTVPVAMPGVSAVGKGDGEIVLLPNDSLTYSIVLNGLTSNATKAEIKFTIGPTVSVQEVPLQQASPSSFVGTTIQLTQAQKESLKGGSAFVLVHTMMNPLGELGAPVATSFTKYGSSCMGVPGVTGAPVLSAFGIPAASQTVHLHLNGPPNAIAVTFVNIKGAQLPLGGGCTFYVSPQVLGQVPPPVTLLFPLDSTGNFTGTFVSPNVGSDLWLQLQSFMAEPLAPLGFVASNGLTAHHVP